MSEREFNKVALLLGDFIVNLRMFKDALVKSDTLLDSCNKLLDKFSVVNIKFEQAISYSNTRSVRRLSVFLLLTLVSQLVQRQL